jgi:hypothetical protein
MRERLDIENVNRRLGRNGGGINEDPLAKLGTLRVSDLVSTLKKNHLITSAKDGIMRRVEPRDYFGLGPQKQGIFLKPTQPTATSGAATATTSDGAETEGKQSGMREDPLSDNTASEANYEDAMKYLRLIPGIIARLAERHRKTRGFDGILSEYHQTMPMMAAFAGYASVKLGDIGVAKYRRELEDMFNTQLFDKRQEVKFGRRAGKTYMACIIIACLILTQPDCSGYMAGATGQLAKLNVAVIRQIVLMILKTESLGFSASIIGYSKSEYTLTVLSAAGTENFIRCTPNPDVSTMRGQGKKGGFFFVDESDFMSQKFWDEVGAIWSMGVLVCLYSSQGLEISPASKMIEKAILANGRRVWRQYRIRPGKVSLIISSDYAIKEETSDRDFILFGKRPEGEGPEMDPVRILQRNWFDPVLQTLAERTYQLKHKMSDEKMLELTGRSRHFHKKDKKVQDADQMVLEEWGGTSTTTNNGAKTSTLAPTNPQQQQQQQNQRQHSRPYNPRNHRSASLTMEQSAELKHETTAIEEMVQKSTRDGENVTLNTDECVWLLTLPGHQDVNAMLMLKAGADKTAFNREMLSYLPDLLCGSKPAFNKEKIDELFHPANRFKFIASSPPLRWVIGFDPGQGSSSDAIFISALMYLLPESLLGDERWAHVSAGGAPPSSRTNGHNYVDIVGASSMRQTMVVRRGSRKRIGEAKGRKRGPSPPLGVEIC